MDASRNVDALGDVAKGATNPNLAEPRPGRVGREDERRNSEEEAEKRKDEPADQDAGDGQ
jgi:hypothetical protein